MVIGALPLCLTVRQQRQYWGSPWRRPRFPMLGVEAAYLLYHTKLLDRSQQTKSDCRAA